MKQYKIFAFLAAVLLLLSALVCPGAAEPVSRPDTSGAVSVLIYNLDSDSLVFSQNSDQLVYPCSTVKIMVALVAIEYFENTEQGLDTWLTVPAEERRGRFRRPFALSQRLERGKRVFPLRRPLRTRYSRGR